MRGRSIPRLGSALFLVGLVAVAVAARSALADAVNEIGRARIGLLAAAFAALVAGRGVVAVASWTMVARRLAGVGTRPAALAWLGSLVGKYIPGGIWQPVGAIDRLRRSGARTADAASVVVMDAATSIVAGLAVGLVAVPGLVRSDRGTAAWLLLGLPALLLLHPKVFALAFRAVYRLRGGDAPTEVPRGSLVAAAVVLQAIGWVLAGVSLSLVLSSVGGPARPAFVVPAAALSWAAGLLVLIAPAGLGVREVVLLALLSTITTRDVALAAAVLSRGLFVLLDVGGTVIAVAMRKR